MDLRGEATECAFPASKAKWIQIPLGDNSAENQHLLFKQAIDEVVMAYRDGKKVAFHCGAGKGSTGTVAAGTLLALGAAHELAEAESKAKEIRSIIDIKPLQKAALKKIYK